ncbi:MAG: AAA family ATPase, partial [Erysipelotrichaceae bacterium]|nr:AAA family ATPase [Erysipelotrichaceae bacterium]
INRGNLSKIFGELFMLIENDKRGSKHQMRLLYSNDLFYVPENVYIIGMMNTADRSLAMMDYALRRRFAFFEMIPAFDSDGFDRYKEDKNNKKFNKLIDTIQQLNNQIENDDSLGSGFRIGHSYFCTNDEVTDEWMHSVVEYEIIPLLKEYWFDEPAKIKTWADMLRGSISD